VRYTILLPSTPSYRPPTPPPLSLLLLVYSAHISTPFPLSFSAFSCSTTSSSYINFTCPIYVPIPFLPTLTLMPLSVCRNIPLRHLLTFPLSPFSLPLSNFSPHPRPTFPLSPRTTLLYQPLLLHPPPSLYSSSSCLSTSPLFPIVLFLLSTFSPLRFYIRILSFYCDFLLIEIGPLFFPLLVSFGGFGTFSP